MTEHPKTSLTIDRGFLAKTAKEIVSTLKRYDVYYDNCPYTPGLRDVEHKGGPYVYFSCVEQLVGKILEEHREALRELYDIQRERDIENLKQRIKDLEAQRND